MRNKLISRAHRRPYYSAPLRDRDGFLRITRHSEGFYELDLIGHIGPVGGPRTFLIASDWALDRLIERAENMLDAEAGTLWAMSEIQ